MVNVRILFEERDLRHRVKAAGASWDPDRRLWQLPYYVARQLGLGGRIVKQ